MKTTTELTKVLLSAGSGSVAKILEEEKDKFAAGENAFEAYLKERLKAKKITQQEAFLHADVPERYGYKLLSGEKKTRKRDVILSLLLGAHLTLPETERALKLYGMSPLYARIPRDAVLMIAFNNQIYEIEEVNRLLTDHGLEPLEKAGKTEDEEV